MVIVGEWNTTWTALVVAVSVGIILILSYSLGRDNSDGEGSWIGDTIITVSDDVIFMDYYTPSDFDDFRVESIYLRRENNFLQGLYFDQEERLFYESAGLYGHSHFQKLVPSDEAMSSLLHQM